MTSRRYAGPAGALVLAAVLALAGCGSHGNKPSAGARGPSSTPSATDSPLAAPSTLITSPPPSKAAAPPTRASAPRSSASLRGNGTARYAFPVDGNVSYGHTHALYPATDIIAPCGATVRAPVDGAVLELSRVDRFVKSAPDGLYKGGLFVSILGADGVRYYSAHLLRVAPSLAPGKPLRAGEIIGAVGHTGNANGVCHVHFALSPPCHAIGDWWLRRGVVYPWPYLDSWRAGGQRSPAAEVAAWQDAHGCRGKLPTDGPGPD